MNMNTLATHQCAKPYWVKPIPMKAPKVIGFSPELLEHHYENIYGGVINTLNNAHDELIQHQQHGEPEEIISRHKKALAILETEKLLHETYFACLSDTGKQDSNKVNALPAFSEAFGDVQNWKSSFKELALSDEYINGWTLLSMDTETGALENMHHGESDLLPTKLRPVAALPVRSDAFHLHFEDNKEAFVDAFLGIINWTQITRKIRSVANPDSTSSPHEESPDHGVTLKEISKLTSEGVEPVLLDVRLEQDRNRYGLKIPGTDWVETHDVSQVLDKLPKDKPVVTYCLYGFWVSQDAATALRQSGINAKYLKGGIAAWKAMNHKTEPL